MERADRTNYEMEEPGYVTEDMVVDRANAMLDEKLRHLEEVEERMARNAGHHRDEG